MIPKLVQKVWKVIQDISIEHHKEMYSMLGVKLSPKDYDPESWYGGMSHPHTGKCLPKKYQLKATIARLLMGIATERPVGKEKSDTYLWIVWPEGDGVPIYQHSVHGVNWLSNKPVDYHDGTFGMVPKCRLKPSKGKLLSSGQYGLGVPYTIACSLWTKNVVDTLPELEN
ncbi:hypothetical protein LCGC14_0355900 [marine sediment metagenome]|uniref:Uncharacterized protein n=1 Tax=marine sediment metagenome TaxID=412755 RepID=A0A0F9WHJ5_9ZZZZ